MSLSTSARRALLPLALAVSLSAAAATAAVSSSAARASSPARSDTTRPMRIDAGSYEYGHTLATLSGRQLETTFMGGMIMHHHEAIAMAKLELKRGSSPQINRAARQIIASQTREIREMTRWLRRWYGITPAQAVNQAPEPARGQIAEMSTNMQSTMMAPLENTPAGHGFDVEFVSLMIAHHQMAILETPPIQDAATHLALQSTAGEIARSQEREVIQFLGWLKRRA